MIGKIVANMATTKTTDLSEAAIQARYITNFYPKEAATQEMSLVSSDWKEGDFAVVVNLLKRYGAGPIEVDGTVTVDGEPAQYMGLGVYSKVFSGGATAAKTVRISTSSGQVAEFQVAPPKPLKLVSVNGAKSDAAIDMTKDLTLGFDGAGEKDSFIRVALVAEGLGMRNFSDIGIYKLGKTVKIPAAAFRHPSLQSNASARLEGRTTKSSVEEKDSIILSGPNTLLVERFETKTLNAPAAGAVEGISQGWAWMRVNVSGKVPTIFKIETAGAKGGIEYNAEKPNASTGKPLVEAKKLAIISLTVYGALIRATESQLGAAGLGDVTTTTKTFIFPRVPVAYWDNTLENIHDGLSKMLKTQFGSTVISTDKVLAAKTYGELAPITEVDTDHNITHAYKGLKILSVSQGDVKRVTATFADDRTETRLMRELGVDGLVEATVHFGLTDAKTLTTTTTINYRIIGGPNGYQSNTSYAQGQVTDVAGKNFSAGQFKTEDSLGTVIPVNELISAIGHALSEQEAKAKELGYHAIWNMQEN
ncbi:MAG: hypothetical protein V4760_08320 [Bdellovibrionota bacterium]